MVANELISGTALQNPATVYQDKTLHTETVYFQGVGSYIKCFMARPTTHDKLPGLLLVHEDRGLNRHAKTLAQRMAVEGYHVIAPDALSPLGGTIDESNENKSTLKRLNTEDNLQNFERAIQFLRKSPFTTRNVGIIGFCWGGGIVNQLIVKARHVDAAVSYYGPQTPLKDVRHINVPLLLHYAENDPDINPGICDYLLALLKYKKDFVVEKHPDTEHGFNNFNNKSIYNHSAAKKAWKQTFQFLNKRLA